MKRLLLFCLLFFFLSSSALAFPDQNPYAGLLERYVSEEGQVDYEALRTARPGLQAYLAVLAEVEESQFALWTPSEQAAFLINLYNAGTLELVLEHYPVESIKDIGGLFRGPWALKVVSLFGKKRSLDYVEHKLLRKHFKDARLHFALVCAAKGCPPLRNEPYDPDRLSEQLSEQGLSFMAQKEKNWWDALTGTFYLSPIFKWYKKDFLWNHDSLAAFLRHYFPEPLPEKIRVKYTEYDWSLNDWKGALQ